MPVINGQDVDWSTYNYIVNTSGLGNAPRNPDGTIATVDQRPVITGSGSNAVGAQTSGTIINANGQSVPVGDTSIQAGTLLNAGGNYYVAIGNGTVRYVPTEQLAQYGYSPQMARSVGSDVVYQHEDSAAPIPPPVGSGTRVSIQPVPQPVTQPVAQPATNPNDYLPFEQWVQTQPEANRAYLLQQGPSFAVQFGYKGPQAAQAQPVPTPTNQPSGATPPSGTGGQLSTQPVNTAVTTTGPVQPKTPSPPGPAAQGNVWVVDGQGNWVQQPIDQAPQYTGPVQTVSTSGNPGQAQANNNGTATSGIGPGGQVGTGITTPQLPNGAGGMTDEERAQYTQALQTMLNQNASAADRAAALSLLQSIGSKYGGSYTNVTTGGTNVNLTTSPYAGLSQDQFNKLLQTQLGVGQLQEGQATPLGSIIGGLPQGLGSDFLTLVLQKARDLTAATGRNATYNQQTGQWEYGDLTPDALQRIATAAYTNAQADSVRAAIGQKDTELRQHQQQLDDAVRTGDKDRAQREQEFIRSLQLDRDKLAEQGRQADQSLQFNYAQLAAQTGTNAADLAERARQFNVSQSGYLNGQSTLAREQQAFEQQKTIADAAANPRNYLAASMLANNRGGLAGQAPTNAMQGTTASAFRAPIPGMVGATTQAPATQSFQAPTPQMGQVGSPDHVATMVNPSSGAQLHFFAAPVPGADTPITAATRALMENRVVPSTGGIQGANGGYVNADQFRAAFAPNKIRAQDYARLAQYNPTAAEQVKAAASFAGYDPADFEGQLKAQQPGFRAPLAGSLKVA